MNNNLFWSIVVGIGIIAVLTFLFSHLLPKHETQAAPAVTEAATSTPPSDDFNKQLECSNERPQVEAAIANYNASQHASYSCATTDPCGIYKSSENLYRLFYSPTLNTCVDVVESQTFLEASTGPQIWYDDYLINDALTGDMKDYIDLVKHSSAYYSQSDLLKKLAEYEPTSSDPRNIGQP